MRSTRLAAPAGWTGTASALTPDLGTASAVTPDLVAVVGLGCLLELSGLAPADSLQYVRLRSGADISGTPVLLDLSADTVSGYWSGTGLRTSQCCRV